MIIYQ